MRRDAEAQDLEERGGHVSVAPVRPRSAGSRLPTAVGVVAVVLGMAILKPWGVAAPSPSPAARLATPEPVIVTPEPTADRSAAGLAGAVCLGPGGWRVASLERWRTDNVRVWRAIEPADVVTGPLDPAIPSVPIVALELTALGWCAPAYGPNVPVGPANVTAWWVDRGVAAELPLAQVQPVDGVTPIAALYRPLATCPPGVRCRPAVIDPTAAPATGATTAGLGPWMTGRVVFHWVDEGAGTEAWLAADIQIITADGGVDLPAATIAAVP